jgi:hypothetical protein
MGAKLVAKTSENLHILLRLSARENFIAVIFLKTHVLGNWSVPINSVGGVTNMSPEMDHSRGYRRALRSVCFDLTVAWLTADKHFTESNSGDKFKS